MSQSVLMLKTCKFLSVGNSRPCKVFYSVDTNHTQIMTRELMLSLMNRATNGNELLAVLDSFVEDLRQSD